MYILGKISTCKQSFYTLHLCKQFLSQCLHTLKMEELSTLKELSSVLLPVQAGFLVSLGM